MYLGITIPCITSEEFSCTEKPLLVRLACMCKVQSCVAFGYVYICKCSASPRICINEEQICRLHAENLCNGNKNTHIR